MISPSHVHVKHPHSMIPNVRFHPYIRDGFVWGVKYMNGGWMILPSFFFRMETGPLIDLWWFISFKWSFSIAKLNHHRLSLNFRLGGDQLQHLKPWGLPWFPQVQLHLSSSFGAAFIASVPGNVRAGWFRNTVGNWHHSGSVMGILEIFGNEVVGECWG
jgi:hypothetical protein